MGVSRRILRWEGRARCRRGCVPRSVRTAGRRVPLTRVPLTWTDVKLFRERHFGGARGGRMTTVWRPKVRIPVPNVDGADVDEKRRDELTTKGTKRKRAPPTKYPKGPCEHGVKHRSKCRVCGACPHGRERNTCKECGGASICEHGRRRTQCKECGGSSICEHGRRRSKCKECGGSGVCEHGRQRYRCKECGGASICEHGRIRYQCKECGGSQICEHGRRRSKCKECRGL